MTANRSTTEIALNGLDGGNPLGFLAAIGTLRIATEAIASANWRISWNDQEGYWSPVLLGDIALTEDSFINLLMPHLTKMQDAFRFADDLTINYEEFRQVAQSAYNAANLTDRHYADFIAAFGCDSLPISAKDSRIQDTALRTMSGAGHQHFIGSMRELVKSTGPNHLHSSLFGAWQYLDPKPSLRWDPLDDRRYALRWKQPSEDPVRTMRGANRLAIEALPLFPTAPGEQRLYTTGFSQRRGEGILFSWPIWEGALSIEVVRSTLSLAELQEPLPDRNKLLALGIVEVYQSQRITEGKYRNFTLATPV